MKCKTKREFIHRDFSRNLEAKPLARRKINKKKYYGIKININDYKKQIYDHFYQPKLLKKLLKGNEPLSVKLEQYLFQISSNLDKLLEVAKKLLLNAYEKGSKRVIDNSGDEIKLDKPLDEATVDVLTGQQVTYYNNLTNAQSKKINELIEDGVKNGLTNDQIANNIESSIKDISKSRALRISRTEMVKSHSIAQIETMQQAGIEEYNYISSNDSKVSKICRHNQGPKGRERIYKTALAGNPDNPLPVLNSHPGCRCTVVAYIRK